MKKWELKLVKMRAPLLRIFIFVIWEWVKDYYSKDAEVDNIM